MTIQFNGTYGISLSGNVIANYFIGNIEANDITSNHIGIIGNADVGGNVTVSANVIAPYITGTLTTNAQPNITSVGNLNGLGLSGDIIPTANVMYSLGNSTHQWKDLWVSNNTIYLNSVPINLNAGNILQVDGINVALSSNSYVNSGNVTTTANVNGANIVAAANVNSANVTASNSVVSPSVVGGSVSLVGNSIINTGPNLFIDPNGTGGVDGNVIIQGNLIVNGTTTTIHSNVVSIDDLTFTVGGNTTSAAQANGAGFYFGNAPYATLTYNSTSNGLVSSNDLYSPNEYVTGTIYGNVATFTGNVDSSNIRTSGSMSAVGNAIAANFNTVGKVVAGSDISSNGIISAVGNILTSGNVSATGNAIAANFITSGKVSTMGDMSSAGNVSASGNVYSSGDLSVAGAVTFGSGTAWGVAYLNASKQVSTGSTLSTDGTHLTSTGNISAIGAVTAPTLTAGGAGNISIVGNVLSTTAQTVYIDPLNDGTPNGNLVVYGNLQVTGNLLFNDVSTTMTSNLVWQAANSAASNSLASGGGLAVGPQGAAYATWLYNQPAGVWQSNLGATFAGTISSVGLVVSGNEQVSSLGVGTGASGTAGEIRATNNVTAFYASDKRFKENAKSIPDALEKAIAVGGKTFDWTDEYIAAHGGEDGYFVRKNDIGVIAQDVQAQLPQAVRTREDGSLAVDYAKLSALALAAIAELSARLDQVTAELAELKNK